MTRHLLDSIKKPEGSIKVCVLNGSRQIDMVIDQSWITMKVLPEAGLPVGVYQLADAKDPSLGGDASFSRAVVHVNDRSVWQFSDQGIVKHPRSLFSAEPRVGREYIVDYVAGRGLVVDVMAQDRARNRISDPDLDVDFKR